MGQMAAEQNNELIPSARRLVTSLRDMGYDFSAAVADLVDNSVVADATLVAIDVEFDGDDSWVRIADNGCGMATAQLKESMRYGAERDYDADDLGKFGLGLKTASLSQCQRLSVASRTNPKRAEITAFCWDLAHIQKTNRWELIPLDRQGLGPAIREPLKDTCGTVVLWQKLDRILGFKHPYGEAARKCLSAMCRELEEHLAMVFHRFLGGEVSGKRFKILLNGNEVKPWDPYARNEPKTNSLTTVKLPVEHNGVKGEIVLAPFVLPHEKQFSSPDAHTRMSGPRRWNHQQGFYIYRANRMIQSGGWCNLRTLDEHTKLARVALRFSPKLDDAFKINVSKMRVQLPPQLHDQIERALGPVIKIAQETYRKGAKQPAITHQAGTTSGGDVAAPPADNANSSTPSRPSTAKLWTFEEIEERIQEVARSDEKPVIARVFERLRGRLK